MSNDQPARYEFTRGFANLFLFFGIGSLVLHWIDMQFCLLIWIDNWGPGIGYVIRCSMVLLGFVLYQVSLAQEHADKAKPSPPDAAVDSPDVPE